MRASAFLRVSVWGRTEPSIQGCCCAPRQKTKRYSNLANASRIGCVGIHIPPPSPTSACPHEVMLVAAGLTAQIVSPRELISFCVIKRSFERVQPKIKFTILSRYCLWVTESVFILLGYLEDLFVCVQVSSGFQAPAMALRRVSKTSNSLWVTSTVTYLIMQQSTRGRGTKKTAGLKQSIICVKFHPSSSFMSCLPPSFSSVPPFLFCFFLFFLLLLSFSLQCWGSFLASPWRTARSQLDSRAATNSKPD